MTTDEAVLEKLADEEERLQFPRFDNDVAIAIGLELVARGRAGRLPIAVDVTCHGHQLFHAALPGTSADNGEWIRRKNRVVNRFARSSLYMGTLCRIKGVTLEEKYILPPFDYAPHGGAFPVRIRGSLPIGTITVSGLPQIDDHALVVAVIADHLATRS